MTDSNSPPPAKMKLLLVDDEPHNLDLLYRTFRRQFQIFKAESAMNALEIMETEGEMAVIISDHFMPEMNGIEFLSKTITIFPDTIRILLSGLGEEELESSGETVKDAEIFKILTKPCNIDELKNVMQEAVETYQKQKENK